MTSKAKARPGLTLGPWLARDGLVCKVLRYDPDHKVHCACLSKAGEALVEWQQIPRSVYVTPEEEDQFMEQTDRVRKHPRLFDVFGEGTK